jgi:hypothetical protein
LRFGFRFRLLGRQTSLSTSFSLLFAKALTALSRGEGAVFAATPPLKRDPLLPPAVNTSHRCLAFRLQKPAEEAPLTQLIHPTKAGVKEVWRALKSSSLVSPPFSSHNQSPTQSPTPQSSPRARGKNLSRQPSQFHQINGRLPSRNFRFAVQLGLPTASKKKKLPQPHSGRLPTFIRAVSRGSSGLQQSPTPRVSIIEES